MSIDDTDPLWDEHDGGSGHDGPGWQPGDEALALAYWEALDEKGRDVLGYLIANSGRRVHRDELVERLHLNPDGTKSGPHVTAAALGRAGHANGVAGRCFPYRWWKTPDGAVYAVQQRVAEIFKGAVTTAGAGWS